MSSRLTAAQIIAQGDYLEPDFEPSSLTISQLLGILGYHNIIYPTPYSKPKLVQVFNDEVKRRASKFKKERLKKENSIASDDGIKDGITGEYISKKPPSARRSSRRLSHAPPDDDDESPPRPDPPKRRRSSAQPRLGGSSRQAAVAIQPAVQEESEPEEEVLPARKVGRTKKTAETAGAQSRRVSQGDDSGWEDNNIFQSGAESSSPIRPSPARYKSRRSSAAPRKSRKSMSAPPNVSPSSSPSKASHVPILSPPQSNFEPELPMLGSTPARQSARFNFVSTPYSPPTRTFKQEDPDEEGELAPDTHSVGLDTIDVIDELKEEEFIDEAPAHADQSDEDAQNVAIQQRLSGQVIDRRESTLEEPKSASLFARFLTLLVAGLLSYAIYDYKTVSASIGYCDTGSDTNSILDEVRSVRAHTMECNTLNRSTLYDLTQVNESPACPPPLLNPFYPDSCTPCPEHAVCSGHAVTCEKAYVLQSPLLLSFLPPTSDPTNVTLSVSLSPVDMAWKVISELTDGLPGFGSVALPPSCVEDPRRKRHIGALGKGIESLLGQHRGERLCSGDTGLPVSDEDGGEARRWGMQLHELKETMRQGADPHRTLPNFDDLFNEAVQQLAQWGGILIGEDVNGERYLAHKSPTLSWSCQVTVKSRNLWTEWRSTVLGLAALILTLRFNRTRRAKQKLETQRVGGLVQIALDTLRHQELAHHIDPVTAPHPYLSSIQLRDLVLQDEHSVAMRKRLWERVEKVVEGNANVRANMEEVEGGDELRVWRWVGSAGSTFDTRQIGSAPQSPSSVAIDTEDIN